MKSALHNDDSFLVDLITIHEPVLSVDAPGPMSHEIVAKGLGLADALEG